MLAEPPFSLLENLSNVDDAVDRNADIADAIFECGLEAFGLPKEPEFANPQDWQGCAKAGDVDKAHSTIRQLYRDWSAEGAQERKPCHDYVLNQLKASFLDCPASAKLPSRPRILVPGAGLGRLVYEICRAGYDVEGNEISYHQLLTSSWILNHAKATPVALYPFATQFSNLYSRGQQLRRVMIPDIFPAQEIIQASASGEGVGEMSMTAADFTVLYSAKESQATFDAVATTFFIDTAPNFIRYVDTVRNCLKASGIWINVGPLLWHSDVRCRAKADDGPCSETAEGGRDRDTGIGEPGSFELTDEEVMWLLERKGFRMEHQEILSDMVGYMQDPDSMLRNEYRVSAWVGRKTG
jgi:carnosine N-methyltransferase